MHLKGFGEGQCFTNKAPPALAQGVVEALHVICRAPFGVVGLMVAGGQDIVIALQDGPYQVGFGGQRGGIEPKGAGRWRHCADPVRRATIWRVRRHKASHSPVTPRRRWPTKLHSSSSSRTSSGWAATKVNKVAASGGTFRAFFQTGGYRVARHAESSGESPSRREGRS